MRGVWVLAIGMVMLPFAGCLGDDQDATRGDGSAAESSSLDIEQLIGKTLAAPRGSRTGEFHHAIDPTDPMRIAVGMVDGDDPAGGSRCALFLSEDGGSSWSDITPTGFRTPQGQLDPWVDFDADGGLHMACIDFNSDYDNGASNIVMAHSTDRGATWTTPAIIPGANNDREVLFFTSKDTMIYCTSAGGILLQRSTDRGATFVTLANATAGGVCFDMLELPDGTLVLLTGFWGFNEFLISQDDGMSWTKTPTLLKVPFLWDVVCPGIEPSDPAYTAVVLACWLPLMQDPRFPHPIMPGFAVSPVTGNLFIAWHGFVQDGSHGGLGSYQVHLFRSSDKAQSFQPLDFPFVRPCAECHTARPTLQVDGEGRLAMMWQSGPMAMPAQTWFSASADEGQTWAEPILLSSQAETEGEWNPGNFLARPESYTQPVVSAAQAGDATAVNKAQGATILVTFYQRYQGGDYSSMAVSPLGFVPMWIDQSDGKPHMWSAVVSVS